MPIFTSDVPVDGAHGQASIGQTALALAIAAATFLALIAPMFDRRFAVLAQREAEAIRQSEERFRLMLRSATIPAASSSAVSSLRP